MLKNPLIFLFLSGPCFVLCQTQSRNRPGRCRWTSPAPQVQCWDSVSLPPSTGTNRPLQSRKSSLLVLQTGEHSVIHTNLETNRHEKNYMHKYINKKYKSIGINLILNNSLPDQTQ